MDFHENWHVHYVTGGHFNVFLPKFSIISNNNVTEVKKREAGTTETMLI